MKTINRLLLAAVTVGGMVSCETDIERAELLGFNDPEPKELTASTNDVVMEGVNEENEAVTFTWGDYQLSVDNPAYELPDGSVQNYLEMSATPDFTIVESQLVEGHMITFTEKELNTLLINMGYEPWQSASLYVRVQYYIAANTDSKYSQPILIRVTPYGIRMNRMDVLATDRETVLGTLYSPDEDGVYTGYIAAASQWMNFYLRERDNTLWGSQPGSAYTMSRDEQTFYNLWLPQSTGSYRLTADVNDLEWTAEYLDGMTLTSGTGMNLSMRFRPSENVWVAEVTTTGAETFSAMATTRLYGMDREDGVEGLPINFGQILSIPEAGDWTITFNLSGEQPMATYAVGEGISYEPYLEMIAPDNWDDVKCRLFSPESNGMYTGFYYAGEWENYKFATVGRETVYGSRPNSLYALDTSSSSWNIYVDTGVEGLYMYTVSLPEGTWSYRAINSLSVVGDFNGWSAAANPMAYDEENKVWTAELDITNVGSGLRIVLDGNNEDSFRQTGDGMLGYGEGTDILPSAAGRYLLTVNLYDRGNLTYTLTAL